MNIDNLKLFCLVVDEGSFSQAARLSFVSQPAVTRQISQLESFYGTLLFDRSGGKLKITETGKILYAYAKTIVNDFERSKSSIQEKTKHHNANFQVGASFTIGEYVLPRVLGQFKKKNPDIKISLTIKNTPGIIEDITNNVIDLALVEGIVENKELIVEKFADDELILICAPDHQWQDTVNLDDLTTERMIWRESLSGTRLIVENLLKNYGILERVDSYMEIGSTQAIKNAVEAGLGISIMSRLSVAKELEQGSLREIKIEGVHLIRSLWMVKKEERFYKSSVPDFLELMKDYLGGNY